MSVIERHRPAITAARSRVSLAAARLRWLVDRRHRATLVRHELGETCERCEAPAVLTTFAISHAGQAVAITRVIACTSCSWAETR